MKLETWGPTKGNSNLEKKPKERMYGPRGG